MPRRTNRWLRETSPITHQDYRRLINVEYGLDGPGASRDWSETVIAFPVGASAAPLPILYLLHGQFDWETDWWSPDRGQLNDILAAVQPSSMLLVAPLCVQQRLEDKRSQVEPDLAKFVTNFAQVQAAVRDRNGGGLERQAVLGISMGGKQALALVLSHPREYAALGVLSAKLQGKNYDQLRTIAPRMRGFAADTGIYYHHYCGRREDDRLGADFFANNQAVATEIGGGDVLRVRDQGLHNWEFWRPEVEEFIRQLSAVWSSGVPPTA